MMKSPQAPTEQTITTLPTNLLHPFSSSLVLILITPTAPPLFIRLGNLTQRIPQRLTLLDSHRSTHCSPEILDSQSDGSVRRQRGAHG